MGKSFNPQALCEFARYYGFHYDRIDPAALMEDVLAEMERGLRGPQSSLPMIPSYISPAAGIAPGKSIIALDAGGNNLRCALLNSDKDGKLIMGESLGTPLPGANGPVSAEVFFDRIAALIIPLMEKAGNNIEGIGFCFPYPMEITKEADGILLHFGNVEAPQVIGRAIGAGIRDALEKQNIKVPERIVLINDTVASLLSVHCQIGKAEEAGPMISFILTDGFNTAYPEKHIPKIGFNSPDRPQIVVCESGNFDHRYSGFLDREFDSATNNPGEWKLEKAVSGIYLGPLTFHIIKRALQDGLFSFDKAEEFLSWPAMQTKDLNSFMREPLSQSSSVGKLFGKNERAAIAGFLFLASIVTERGAMLAAATLAAAIDKAGAGFDPLVPARAAVEGSIYINYWGMKRALDSYLHFLLNKYRPRSYILVTPNEQAPLLGAAVAALS